MANIHRGEISAVLDDTAYRLCLTLGALAELENALAEADILALVSRITAGKLKAKECIAIIGAGLRAAGYDISDAQVARMKSSEGASGYITIVARLLTATFGGETAPSMAAHSPHPSTAPPSPFRGTQ